MRGATNGSVDASDSRPVLCGRISTAPTMNIATGSGMKPRICSGSNIVARHNCMSLSSVEPLLR